MSRQILSRRSESQSPKITKGTKDLRVARDAMYRKHIVDIAERVFSETGFENTKMQDVAMAASISLSTLYNAFPSKNELYRAIVVARGDELFAGVLKVIADLNAEGTTPLGMVLRGMEMQLRFFMEHPAFLKMNLLEGHVWYHRSSRPSAEQEDMWANGERLIQSAFIWGMQSGVFVNEDPGSQARTLVTLQQVRLANWVLLGSRATHDEVVAGVQAEVVRTFCRPVVACRVLTDDGLHVRPEALTMEF